ncbi:hypothetical protein ACN28C_28125 [Plantactinospora sp. WMMC1484]|uniref:hypothetical protein n=1 Tax=Plantactinospora sp. WMMC1484 TaxID=3404122 RepID=UPI003BF54925
MSLPERPAGDDVVVICPPVLTDALVTYRSEVLLGRALAARGVTAVRPHYRGTGHSEGDQREVAFERMVSDVTRVAAEFVGQTGGAQVAFVGTRIGALVAAEAARRSACALLLWEPTHDPESFFREAFRASFVRAAGATRRERVKASDLFARLRAGQDVDVLGHVVSARLYASLTGRSLRESLRATVLPTLLLDLTGTAVGHERLRVLAAELTAAGGAVDTGTEPTRLNWWLLDHDWPVPERLVARSTDWLADRLARGVA